MGNICSKKSYKEVSKNVIPAHTSKIGLNFSSEEWKSYHNEGTVDQNQTELQNIGTDLKKADSFPKCLSRAVFICCNTYSNSSNPLGVGSINDAIIVARYLKENGFNVFYLINPLSSEFTKYLKSFIQKTAEYLVIYYTGHSASVDDKVDGTDIKGEAFVFDDSYLFTDKLIDSIIHSGKPPISKLCLISECCHSKPVFDFKEAELNGKKIPPNVISFTTARTADNPIQSSAGGTDQGIFTFYFCKLLSQDDSMTPESLKSQIEQYLNRFQQNFVVFSSSDSILNEPLFK